MRMRTLAFGIIERMTLLGAGYGVLLGAAYGAVSLFMVGLLRGGPFEDIEFGFGGACFSILLGFVIGGALGMAWGLAVGLASGMALALVTILTLDSLLRRGRYYHTTLVLCICVSAVISMLMIVLIATSYSRPLTRLISVVILALITAVAFWRIGGNVATWVERNRLYNPPE